MITKEKAVFKKLATRWTALWCEAHCVSIALKVSVSTPGLRFFFPVVVLFWFHVHQSNWFFCFLVELTPNKKFQKSWLSLFIIAKPPFPQPPLNCVSGEDRKCAGHSIPSEGGPFSQVLPKTQAFCFAGEESGVRGLPRNESISSPSPSPPTTPWILQSWVFLSWEKTKFCVYCIY